MCAYGHHINLFKNELVVFIFRGHGGGIISASKMGGYLNGVFPIAACITLTHSGIYRSSLFL
jgi:hypothetical protein